MSDNSEEYNGRMEVKEEETFYQPKKINNKEMDLYQGLFENIDGIDLMDGYAQRIDKTKIGFGGNESYGKRSKKDINVFKIKYDY